MNKQKVRVIRTTNTYTRFKTMSMVLDPKDAGPQVVDHPFIPLNTTYEGYIMGDQPQVGDMLHVSYTSKNGVDVNDDRNHVLRTTEITKIENNLYYTKNSVYKVENI